HRALHSFPTRRSSDLWRVYVTSALVLTVAAAVQAYRGQYGIEHGFARTKRKTLHLTPLYLQWDDRVDGLVHLLSIGLRLLTLIEIGRHTSELQSLAYL